MYCLSDEEVDFILTDIKNRGIKTESICYNLLDHVCILIEQNLDESGDFEIFYNSAIESFYKKDLREIEEDTYFLLTYKNHLVLTKAQFFLLLFLIFIGPFIFYFVANFISNWAIYRWNIPKNVWGETLAYVTWPLLSLLAIFCTPEKLDPPIPRNSRILLGLKPFVNIIYNSEVERRTQSG